MSVYFQIQSGKPNDVVSTLKRRISGMTRMNKVSNFKIGITNYPFRRWNEQHKNNYDEMLVVYQSESISNVSQLETELINHNWECCDNLRAGGGGSIGEPPYYLYVVIAY